MHLIETVVTALELGTHGCAIQNFPVEYAITWDLNVAITGSQTHTT